MLRNLSNEIIKVKMKQGSKLTKKEQPKSDNANRKESANNESSSGEITPDVAARSRRSLTGISEGNERGKGSTN